MPAESLLPAALGVVLFLVPALALFFGGIPDRATLVALVLGLLATLALAFAEWLVLGSAVDVALFQAALSAAGAAVVLSVALRSAKPRLAVLAALVLVLLVLVPIGFALFDLARGPIVVALGTLDFGGVATVALIPGSAAVAVLLVGRSWRQAGSGVPRRPTLLFPFVALAAVIGFTSASIGAQLLFDELTGTLVLNGIIAALAGAIGWTLTQVINVHRASWAGGVAGVLAGSIVILPASPWLNTVSIVVLALLAGVLGHVSAVAVRRGSAGVWATVIGVCLVPGALGMIGSGIVATGAGLLFSGHIDLLQAQAGGLLVVVLYATGVSLVLAYLVRRFSRT